MKGFFSPSVVQNMNNEHAWLNDTFIHYYVIPILLNKNHNYEMKYFLLAFNIK